MATSCYGVAVATLCAELLEPFTCKTVDSISDVICCRLSFLCFLFFFPPPSLKAETSEPQKWSFASNHHRLERARLARADAPGAEGGGSICFLVAINQWRARNGWTVLHSPFSTLLYSVDKIGQHHQLPPSVVSRLFSFFLILILVCFAFAVFQLFPGQLQLKNQMMLSLSDETFSLSPEWRAELNWILP